MSYVDSYYGPQEAETRRRRQEAQQMDYAMPSGGVGAAPATVGQQLPGLGDVGMYQRTTFGAPQGQGIDLSQPTQIPFGSRSGEIMGDPNYIQLLARLGLDRETAMANAAASKQQITDQYGRNLRELERQTQEDRYGIDAVLRGRGAGRSGQREQLNAKALANMNRQNTNLSLQRDDQYQGVTNELINTEGRLAREEIEGATGAGQRIQSAKDEMLRRQENQRIADEMLRQQAANNQSILDALAASAAAANAQNQPSGEIGAGTSGGGSFADTYNSWSQAEKDAWNAWVRGAPNVPGAGAGAAGISSGGGGGGGYSQPAAAAPPQQSIPLGYTGLERVGQQPITTRPKEPLRPMRGYY